MSEETHVGHIIGLSYYRYGNNNNHNNYYYYYKNLQRIIIVLFFNCQILSQME
jgi:hypothetical protein